MTSRAQAVFLFVAAALVVAGVAFAAGRGAGGDEPHASSARPLEPASHESPRLAATAAVPPLRKRPQAPSVSSGSAETPAPATETATPAPETATPAPETATPAPAAPQPETPAAGE